MTKIGKIGVYERRNYRKNGHSIRSALTLFIIISMVSPPMMVMVWRKKGSTPKPTFILTESQFEAEANVDAGELDDDTMETNLQKIGNLEEGVLFPFNKVTNFKENTEIDTSNSSITQPSNETALNSMLQKRTTTILKRDVHWFNSSKIPLKICGYFSGAWMMNLSTFLQTRTERMKSVEDAVHIVYKFHKPKVRMSEDWMDFSVEHMSKWWKMLKSTDRDDDPVSIQRMIGAFQEYVNQNKGPPISDLFQKTIAVIPAPSQILVDTRSPTSRQWSRELLISSLRATMASIERLGFGRIVVVGLVDHQDEINSLVSLLIFLLSFAQLYIFYVWRL